MQNLKNAQVSLYSLTDLNICHRVELTFFLGQVGKISYINFLKMKFFKQIAFVSESKSRFNSNENCFNLFLDFYHKLKSTQLALKEGNDLCLDLLEIIC